MLSLKWWFSATDGPPATSVASIQGDDRRKSADESTTNLRKPSLTDYCIKISQPQTLMKVAEDTTRKPSETDARYWVMALIIMSAAGHFVKGLMDAQADEVVFTLEHFRRDVNWDVITAEAIVWIGFLIFKLWEADTKSDQKMFELIGSSTLYMASRYSLELIREITGCDYTAQCDERRRFYVHAFKERGDLPESFASIILLSATRRSLEDLPRTVNPTDYIAPEWLALVLNVTIFYSTMPHAYYQTFKNMLREWPDRFPEDSL